VHKEILKDENNSKKEKGKYGGKEETENDSQKENALIEDEEENKECGK
jgi:hypothetical protein